MVISRNKHETFLVQLNDSLNKLEDKLSETDAKIKDEVDVKYQDNLKTVRELGDKISKASKEALAANKKMDGVSINTLVVVLNCIHHHTHMSELVMP